LEIGNNSICVHPKIFLIKLFSLGWSKNRIQDFTSGGGGAKNFKKCIKNKKNQEIKGQKKRKCQVRFNRT